MTGRKPHSGGCKNSVGHVAGITGHVPEFGGHAAETVGHDGPKYALSGADFLWLVLQHVLPKGLRRSRNFGFLHPNSAAAIRLLQVLHLRAVPRVSPADATMPVAARPAWRCVCGQPMHVVRRRMAAMAPETPPTPQPVRVTLPDKPDAAQAETMH